MLNISLIVALAVINTVWIYIFIFSTRLYRNSPKITNSQKITSPSSHIAVGREKTNILSNYGHEIKLPSVSIIVPARNEEREICRCLTSLLGQNYPNYEIIAVDDNSSDNTLLAMQKIRAEHCQSVNRVSENESVGEHQYINQLQSNSAPINVNNSSPQMYNKGQKDNLTLTVSLPTPVYTTTSSSNYKEDKLKIISLKNKPQDWAAKTWASQQGFLHSKGDIIIFTDADTCYIDKNTIKESVSYLLKENLAVFTGFPFIELRDFWSKAVSPVWRLIGIIFGTNLTDINDPKSEAANLNGCFIVIGRKIFQKLGTYEAVRNSIREDEALGMRAKRLGYKIGGACMEDSLTALWSRDFRTLWLGIARTIIPIFMDKRRKTKVVSEMLMLFIMGTLPFMILPYALSISAHFFNSESHFGFNRNRSDSPQYQLELSAQLSWLIVLLDLSACFMLFVGVAGISRREFKISIVYASISPLSAAFLVVAYVSHLLSLEIAHTDHGKFVEWQGRKYFFHQR